MFLYPRRIVKNILVSIEIIKYDIVEIIAGFEKANLFLANFCSKDSVQTILKKYGAQIGHNCDIETGLRFHNCIDFSNLVIGDNCHIGKDCFFDLRDKITIGDNVVISMQCTFITHIDMSKSSLTELYPPKQAPINIENDVYIGSGSQVLKGVKIGEKAFIAAKSLVVRDVVPYTLVGGVPARLIKKIKTNE